ncbi:TetR/AcrR family transcriptional regulator [Paenibacillus sp. 1_12]|uniref:TetR/AcrR family transcriptional regulator n=1 Tax=Paenibacillus sp. 1_12 TaxID=1566278 RepID=UPI000B859949|nr:TetR/AcrR family transcriptional regulator [Paenibacillus sp. 1_12]
MRHKDDNKNEAIFQATIQLLNEIGFSDISMSKIAKRANVSPSTIYVYFENKEDMLKKLYLNVKEKMSLKMLDGINEMTPIQAGFELFMSNLKDFVLDNKDYFLFLEQFTNSPFIERLCLDESIGYFKPILDFVERGQEQHILKKVDAHLLLIYCYYPVTQLAKEHFKGTLVFNQEKLKEITQMSWDAIQA